MITYAFADLHGRFDLLTQALEAIKVHAGSKDHKIVSLGDYVDRGPQSAQIIALLKERQEANPDQMICLKGNHEDMMVETLRKPLHPDWWIGNGGGATLISYGHARSGEYDPSVVPDDHINWIQNLPLMHVDDHRVFVHAGVKPDVPLNEQRSDVLLWMLYPNGAEDGHGKRHVVHGHHQFEYGPMKYKGRTDLDTFAFKTGRLVIGLFDSEVPGPAVGYIEVKGPRYTRWD